MELIESHHLITFGQLAEVAGLNDMFDGRGDFTVFAPSESAWYSIDYELLEEAKRNPDLARRLLLFHSTAGPGSVGRIKTSTIKNNQVRVERLYTNYSYILLNRHRHSLFWTGREFIGWREWFETSSISEGFRSRRWNHRDSRH